MAALIKNNTWKLVPRPKDKRTVGCKWVFTVKFKVDGSVDRYKARLVAKGFTQTYGVDYLETFAPVAKLNTVRILLSLAANLDWPLNQLDIKNAFLNGELEEEVYMDMPPGFEEKGPAGRVWQADHTMFYKRSKEGKLAILIVYVNDIILTGDDKEELEGLKEKLAGEFEIKDLGPLRYFLGMEVARTAKGILVTQRKCTLDLLKDTGMIGCKPAATPIEPNSKLGLEENSAPVERGRYQRLVGRLIYLSHTRLDIAFAVSLVSQFMHAPKEAHLVAVNRILQYLKSTPGKGLYFEKGEKRNVEAFVDADWAGNIMDRKSTTGYCTKVWGNLVTWRSKKQTVVARSSAEAEFRALAHAVCELMWIERVLKELQLIKNSSMQLYCDNKAAINIAHNPVHHDRTKHVEVDRHFIKEKLETGVICLVYILTGQQTADMLTKGMHGHKFEEFVCKLGMKNIYAPA
ncbi:reverse transcriptase Ty1/copia-type domain-containing protein [Citrus sinensis]|nr:reverse transcriptase Ty1/copia-type domain-containing protein [Citrus sinensis]